MPRILSHSAVKENKYKHFVPCENLVFENLYLSGIGPFFHLGHKSIYAKAEHMLILICFPFSGLKIALSTD